MHDYDKRDVNAMAVAQLTMWDIAQDEICRRLNLSNQSEVSRLLKHAREKGWMKPALYLPDQPEVLQEVAVKAYENLPKLRQVLDDTRNQNNGQPFSNVHVVYSGDSDNESERIGRFGRNCADYLIHHLVNAKTCAVAWGRTIQSVVTGIEGRLPAPSENRSSQGDEKPVKFMPLCGEPLNFVPQGVSSSTAAERLGDAFGLKSKTLRGIGVRIPLRLEMHSQAIIEYLRTSQDYSAIFGERGLINRVDAIVSGLGDAQTSSTDPWFSETTQAEDLSAEDMAQLAVGNLAGVWFARDPDDKDQLRRVDELNKRWLGIGKAHLESCARRAAGGGTKERPGVIVVAVGSSKKDIVLRAAGLINHLVIDHTLADALVAESNS